MAQKPKRKPGRPKRMTDTPATPRTTEQKLADAKALVAKYEAQLVAEKVQNDIQTGDDVDFTFGRAESARTLSGVVAGMADTDQGRIIAVTVTDDMGLPDIKRVNIKAISANRTADTRRSADNADPLNAG